MGVSEQDMDMQWYLYQVTAIEQFYQFHLISKFGTDVINS